MQNEDMINLLGILEQAVKNLIEQNEISIEDGCKLIRWLDKADPTISMYTERMREVLREWCIEKLKEQAITVSDGGKTYFVLLEKDFLKHTENF